MNSNESISMLLIYQDNDKLFLVEDELKILTRVFNKKMI